MQTALLVIAAALLGLFLPVIYRKVRSWRNRSRRLEAEAAEAGVGSVEGVPVRTGSRRVRPPQVNLPAGQSRRVRPQQINLEGAT